MSAISEVISTATPQAPIARPARAADSDGDSDGSTGAVEAQAPAAPVSRPTATMGNNLDVFA